MMENTRAQLPVLCRMKPVRVTPNTPACTDGGGGGGGRGDDTHACTDGGEGGGGRGDDTHAVESLKHTRAYYIKAPILCIVVSHQGITQHP